VSIRAELAKGCVLLPDADKRGEAPAQPGDMPITCSRMPYFQKEVPEELTVEEIRALS
jgi:hypothetical protein